MGILAGKFENNSSRRRFLGWGTFFSIYLCCILAFLSARDSPLEKLPPSGSKARPSIPLSITCCKSPGESNRAALGMETP